MTLLFATDESNIKGVLGDTVDIDWKEVRSITQLADRRASASWSHKSSIVSHNTANPYKINIG